MSSLTLKPLETLIERNPKAENDGRLKTMRDRSHLKEKS